MAKPINHSIGCFGHRCRNSFDNTSPTRSHRLAVEETHEAAGKAGWVMGLDSDGQAHYACPDHAGSLFCESPLAGFFSYRQRRAIARRGRKAIPDADVKPGMIVEQDGDKYEVLSVRGAEKIAADCIQERGNG